MLNQTQSTELIGNFGATIQGDGFTTYPVQEGWDGYRYSGYFTPTVDQVIADYGSVDAANAAFAKRYY